MSASCVACSMSTASAPCFVKLVELPSFTRRSYS